MANSYNYATNTNLINQNNTRYMVSRIIDNPSNKLLEIELPAEIPDTFTVEMLLYSVADNSLITSIILTSDDTNFFKLTTLSYADTSIRRLLFMDFSNFVLELENVRMQMVLNFFVPEIGNFSEPQLVLQQISPSRTELELSLAQSYRDTQSINTLVNFASPHISSKWALEAIKYICNQTQSLNTNIPTTTASLSFDILQSYLPISQSIKINDPTVSGLYTASIKQSTQTILNNTYAYASESIKNMILTQSRFTDTMLINIISSSLGRALTVQGVSSPSDSPFRIDI